MLSKKLFSYLLDSKPTDYNFCATCVEVGYGVVVKCKTAATFIIQDDEALQRFYIILKQFHGKNLVCPTFAPLSSILDQKQSCCFDAKT